MPKRKRTRKTRTLDDFFKTSGKGKSVSKAIEEREHDRPRSTLHASLDEQKRVSSTKSSSKGRDVDVYSLIEELLNSIMTKKEQPVIEETLEKEEKVNRGLMETKEHYSEIIEQQAKTSLEISKHILPTGNVLRELLKLPVGPERGITCDNNGVCSDGISISQVYVDKYGFKRQRGFIRTTRIPVYVDWIVEEALVSKVLPTAYKVETNRGSIALVPKDFLCELDKRYGVLLKNYDCSNYKVAVDYVKKKK